MLILYLNIVKYYHFLMMDNNYLKIKLGFRL